MKGRVFILTNDPVPFGTANANYIRNFAKAVGFTGMEVVVIGMKNIPEKTKLCYNCSSDKIQFWNLNGSKAGCKNYINVCFNYKKQFRMALEYFEAQKNDYIVVYSTELDTAKAAIEYSIIPNNHKAFCEVEWFQPYQYKYGRFNPLYIFWNIGFQYRMRKFYKAIPISTNLERLFARKKCETLVVPALVDTDDMIAKRDMDDEYVHLIYPGAASDKDSFPCMIKAIWSIGIEKRRKLKFHLTGSMTCEKLLAILGEDEAIMNDIKDNLVFHGWLEYDDLMRLYGKIDFLLIAREKNIVTLSNFPSKVPEMMSYGVIPVCSAVGDYTTLYLRDGIDSIQFKEDSVSSCAEAICKAMEVKNSFKFIEMQKSARETAVKKLDYRNWGEKIVDFLQN